MARQEAVAASGYIPESGFDYTISPTASVWGENVFSFSEMAQRLPKSVFKALKKTIEAGEPLDPIVADAVAEAMKTWAIEEIWIAISATFATNIVTLP